jgi:hypothetical protein
VSAAQREQDALDVLIDHSEKLFEVYRDRARRSSFSSRSTVLVAIALRLLAGLRPRGKPLLSYESSEYADALASLRSYGESDPDPVAARRRVLAVWRAREHDTRVQLARSSERLAPRGALLGIALLVDVAFAYELIKNA